MAALMACREGSPGSSVPAAASTLGPTAFRGRRGTSPRVLTSDNMILALAKKGELTATKTPTVVNATVIQAVAGRRSC